MLLRGSCHCGKVRYTVESDTPFPFSHCHCLICRKLAGSGGSTVNIMANTKTMKVRGEQHLSIYRSNLNDRNLYEKDGLGYSRRHFCKHCGTMMWNHNNRHAHWIYLFASSVDTPLPIPPDVRHTMVKHKAAWTVISDKDEIFEQYPDESIEDWHKNRDLFGST